MNDDDIIKENTYNNNNNNNNNKTSYKSTESDSTDNIFNKTELMRLNNGWNDKNERLIISLGENAASYKWMHEKCAGYNKIVNKFINVFLIFLSTSLTTETIFPQETCPNNSLSTLGIIKRLFVYLVNLLSVLQSFFKSEVIGEKHSNASGSFSNLYHDIQQQMCMFRRDRINATKYVSDCLKQYDTLILNSPDINSYVLKMFKKTFKNSGISLPDIVDKIQKIEIITEDNNRNKDDYKNLTISSSTRNCNNLQEIHNAFQIQGDITDKELENVNYTDLRKKFLKQKSEYEYNRFLEHSREID
jgi:hypothetical protein